MSEELNNQLREALLKRDAAAFNRLRASNQGTHCVIRAENGESQGNGEPEAHHQEERLVITGGNLSDFDLRGLTFTLVDFSEVVFGRGSLASVTFDECTLHGCDVTAQNTRNLALKNCCVVGGRFEGVSFSRVDVEGTWFQDGVALIDCDFSAFSANKGHFIDVRVTPEAKREQLSLCYGSGIKGPVRPKKPASAKRKR